MTISQREARRLRARVHELETIMQQARQYWRQDYPAGIHLGTVSMVNNLQTLGRVEGARICGHAVVVSVRGDSLTLYAVNQPNPNE